MAMFLCGSHGEIVASFVSPSVAVAVNAGADLDVLSITIDDGLGTSVNEVDQAFVAEIVREGLLSADSLTGSSEESSWEISCRLEPVCGKCLAEWLSRPRARIEERGLVDESRTSSARGEE